MKCDGRTGNPPSHRTHPHVPASSHKPRPSAAGLVVHYGTLLQHPRVGQETFGSSVRLTGAFAGSRTNVAYHAKCQPQPGGEPLAAREYEPNMVLATTQFDVVGTRPLRHDGTDKVTGRALYGADFTARGPDPRGRPAQPSRPRTYQVDRHEQGGGGAGRPGRRHRRRLPGRRLVT